MADGLPEPAELPAFQLMLEVLIESVCSVSRLEEHQPLVELVPFGCFINSRGLGSPETLFAAGAPHSSAFLSRGCTTTGSRDHVFSKVQCTLGTHRSWDGIELI